MSRSLDYDDYRPYEEHIRDREVEILNLIILIRVLTFIIPVILTLTPISLTDPRASTACTPELGESET